MKTATAQTQVRQVDLQKFSGKWYVIACIPTYFDKKWDYVTESYTVNEKGNIDIFTTYVKEGNSKEKSVTSKGFPVKGSENAAWKVQFVWPFKADYLVEELDAAYSYTVIGHPKKDFLYIMAREKTMSSDKYNDIVERFKNRGYEMSQLRKLKQ